MHRELKRTFRAAYAEGTFRNLKTQWNSYVSFCVFYGLNHLSKDPLVLCLYAQLLSHSFVSKGAIENYLSGARTYFRLAGVSDEHFDSIELKMVKKGIARLNPHQPFRATPVTPEILVDIYKILDMDNDNEVVFWALFLIAFFSMSRKSNLVLTKNQKPYKMILRQDVLHQGDKIILNFKWSKTNQFGLRTHKVPLCSIQNSCLCPVKAYCHMVEKSKSWPTRSIVCTQSFK